MEKEQKVKIIRFIISVVLLIVAYFIPINSLLWFRISLFILSFIVCGYDVVIEAFKKIFHGECMGYIVINDQIKTEAIETIKELKERSIKTIMLTGDKKEVAEYVADQVGFDEVFSELLPEDKRIKLAEIQQSNKGKIVFVGDGINDAPVISQADVGIAMGAMGSDAAIEASDIVIMDDNIHKIIDGIKISKKTKIIATENIIFSLAVKFAILLLGALGIVKIGYAIFADVGVLLIATLNAIRTLKMRISNK